MRRQTTVPQNSKNFRRSQYLFIRSLPTAAFHGARQPRPKNNSVITSRLQVSGVVPAVQGCMFSAGFGVTGTLVESVTSLVQPQTIELPHCEFANIHYAEPVLASASVTPST